MIRKAASRVRKPVAAHRAKAAPRASTRTGKKTAIARGVKVAPRPAAQQKGPASPAAPFRIVEQDRALDDLRRDQVQTLTAEEDEDFDWLAEDEDPRSQIVEDDDEDDGWNPDRED